MTLKQTVLCVLAIAAAYAVGFAVSTHFMSKSIPYRVQSHKAAVVESLSSEGE